MKIVSWKGIRNVLLLFLATPFILVAGYWGMLSWHDFQLERRTPESKIIGRTPDQIISSLGAPESRLRNDWERLEPETMQAPDLMAFTVEDLGHASFYADSARTDLGRRIRLVVTKLFQIYI